MRICPSCYGLYGPEQAVCPKDGTATEDAVDVLIGKSLGSYQVRALIGEGGMGVVYAGEHTTIGRRVALKVLRPELSLRDDIVERFVQEARAVNTISHGNIVNIYDFGKTPFGSFYIVMEYLDGKTVRSLLDEEGAQPLQRTMTVISGVGAALAAAHSKGFIHRDVKPENIMLVDRAGVTGIKLLDFGIAKLLTPDGSRSLTTHTGSAMGTPQYMSPEQLEDVAYDHRADIYSLGAVTYEMLTGQLPYPGKTHAEVRQLQLTRTPAPPSVMRPEVGLSRRLDAAVLWALSADASARCSRMEDFVEHLEAGFNEAADAPPPRPDHRRPPIGLVIVVALLAMSLGGGIVYLVRPGRTNPVVDKAPDARPASKPMTLGQARAHALKQVKSGLRSKEPGLVLELLALMHRPMTVVRDELRAILRAADSDPEARKKAAQTLGNIPDPDKETAKILSGALTAGTTTPQVGWVYAWTLARLGDDNGKRWLKAQLQRSGCLGERKQPICRDLLQALGDLRDPGARAGLKQMLDQAMLADQKLTWRSRLAAIGVPEAQKALVDDAERNAEWRIRVEAATGLAQVHGQQDRARQILAEACVQAKGEARLDAAFQLALFRDASSAKVLVEFLESSKDSHRKESAIALGHLGLPATDQALVKALGDPSKDVALAAAVALLPDA